MAASNAENKHAFKKVLPTPLGRRCRALARQRHTESANDSGFEARIALYLGPSPGHVGVKVDVVEHHDRILCQRRFDLVEVVDCGVTIVVAVDERETKWAILQCRLQRPTVHSRQDVLRDSYFLTKIKTASAPGISFLSRLNGWPARPPADASPTSSRISAHGSGS